MMKLIRKLIESFYKRPILFTIGVSYCIFLLFYIALNINHIRSIVDLIFISLSGIIFGLPITLTIENLIFLIVNPKLDNNSFAQKKVEILGLCFGTFFTFIAMGSFNIKLADWNVQLRNVEVHSPISLEAMPTIVILILISLVGYIYCRFVDLKNQPPLATVLGIAAMYLGIIISIAWTIQIWNFSVLLILLPINYIIIILKTVRYLIFQKSKLIETEMSFNDNEKLSKLNIIIRNSSNWPWLGLVAMLPMLGVIIIILILFGQKPDNIIKAWAETADWTFSQKIPPQNIYYDEHYLCTVAAGGHKKVVKPIREGKRHGHKVLVNRQLCIANAFEQILEERLPKLHSFIRSLYDKYGYPIATKIKSPYTADIVYFLMKPLEWIFLIVIYLVDTKPENRIAIQYPHTDIPEL